MSEVAVAGDVGQTARVVGRSPWALAARRLRRNRSALVALAGFIAIVVACLGAGWYAHSVAHTNPFESTIDGTTIINGKPAPVMVQGTGGLGLGVTPIGPTWDIHHYFLGADNQGRDVAARMLYGGRNSLIIATVSAAHLLLSRDHHRADRGLLRRHRRSHPVALPGHHLGLSGLPLCDLRLDRRALGRHPPRTR